MDKNKNIPVYIANLDEEDIQRGVNIISLVENPAIEIDFIAFSKNNDNVVKFAIQNDEKQIVTGPLLIPYQKIYRFSEQTGPYFIYFDEQTIEKTAYKFFKEHKISNTNLEHDSELKNNYVIESWIVKNDGERRGFDVPEGTWMISMKLSDESWKLVKDGEVKGFSIEGFFNFEQTKFHSHQCSDECDVDMSEIKFKSLLAGQLLKKMSDEDLISLRKVKFERWITSKDENVCPICNELEMMGWQPQGVLPRYRKAHSTIGKGKWKASDSACRCSKDSISIDTSKPEDVRKLLR